MESSAATDSLIRWTIRVALALYVAALALRLMANRRRSWLDAARLAWTAGCVAFLTHVACAFHFVHGWSHAAAYEHTARRTAEVVGWRWGSGLYLNYLFGIAWIADASWWWASAASYESRPRWIEWSVQGFLAFIAFNSTAVFGVGAIRWWGLAATGVLLAVAWFGTGRAGPTGPTGPTRPPSPRARSPRR